MKAHALPAAAVLALAAFLFAGGPAAATPQKTSGAISRDAYEALDYAFRFASAIKTDPKDQARAQEAVVLELAQLGAIDAAAERVDRMTGWRKGTTLADLAALYAKQGERKKARALIDRAEATRKGLDGWEERRVAAHVAQALGMLGDVETSESLSAELVEGDARQYAGRAVATVAAARAAEGDYDGARNALDTLREESDFDITWWRTTGWVAIAREADLPRAQRLEALIRATESAEGIDGWKRAEARESIAGELVALGETDRARALLEQAEQQVRAQPDTLPLKAPLLSNLARKWADLKETKRAAALLEAAETLVPAAVVIDRPGIWANIATGYHALGDRDAARATFLRALAEAEGLVNARPRALSVVQICQQMGRYGVALDETTRTKLDALFYGLKAPW